MLRLVRRNPEIAAHLRISVGSVRHHREANGLRVLGMVMTAVLRHRGERRPERFGTPEV